MMDNASNDSVEFSVEESAVEVGNLIVHRS